MNDNDQAGVNPVVLRGGEGGYHTYRIPALLRTAAGTVLLFCEGRCHGSGDFGEIHLLVSRSEDQGQTWSAPTIVHREGDADQGICIGNPCPLLDPATGFIWLVYTRNNEQVGVTHSEDDGRTWSGATDITAQACPKSWGRYWTGPGHGIALRHGPHAGRLLVPCYHIEPYPNNGPDICCCHALFSDDHGTSWQVSGNTALSPEIPEITFKSGWWPNGFIWSGCEALAAELSDGEIYMIVRNQARYRERKAFSRSRDGGMIWTPLQLHEELPGFACQSGLLRLSEDATPSGVTDRLITTGITQGGTGGTSRRGLSWWLSDDGGHTWSEPHTINPGPSGYSDLCPLDEGRILCVYEAGAERYIETLSRCVIETRVR